MSKKSYPISYIKLPYKVGQDFLDRQSVIGGSRKKSSSTNGQAIKALPPTPQTMSSNNVLFSLMARPLLPPPLYGLAISWGTFFYFLCDQKPNLKQTLNIMYEKLS